MAGDLVLLTGATGFVGFATLLATLRHGYRVRAAVRSEQKAETVRSSPALKDIKGGQLEFVVVPDFLIEGAFDEAVKSATFIIHVASPIASPGMSVEKDDLNALMIQPAIQGTLGIFRSAQQANTVRRIVVTSSAAGLIPYAAMVGEQTYQRYGPGNRCEPALPPYRDTQDAYCTSKILALKHAEEFIEAEQPSFDAIHIHPVVVLGRDELATTPKALDSGSNAWALGPVLGRREEAALPAAVTHVNDVALAHVRALDCSKVAGNQSFLLSSTGDEGWTLNTTKDYVQKHFSDAVKEGLIPNNGSTASALIKTDPSKTEQVLGIKPKSFEEMTVDLVGQYVELLIKQAAAGQ